jgi:hypothetical protein
MRRERFFAAVKMKLPAGMKECEIQFSFTRRVNPWRVGFRLQVPQRYAI